MTKSRRRYKACFLVTCITLVLSYSWIFLSVLEESTQAEQQIFELSELLRDTRENEANNSTSNKNLKRKNNLEKSSNRETIPHPNILSDSVTTIQTKNYYNVTNVINDTNNKVNESSDSSKVITASEINDENEETTKDVNFDITDNDDHVYLATDRQNDKRDNNTAYDITNAANWEVQSNKKINNTLTYRKHIYNKYHRPPSQPFGINCSKIISGDVSTISFAHQYMRTIHRNAINVDQYITIAECDNFKKVRGYIEHPLSETERNFPLAFGIMVYRDIEQVERLLRSIYRPHNYYCIHADLKTSENDMKALETITDCFDNVFLTEESINVTWGEFTVLEAELKCMKDTWKYKKWKYYINLTGQEFPLKTNREIVKILEVMDGANIVDGTWLSARDKEFYRWTVAGHRPPHNIRPIKGSVHVAINREFVDFSLHDQRSLDFIQWLKKTEIPDETFFASLNHNPSLGIKGSFLGEPEEYSLKPLIMRYKNWGIGHSALIRKCAGKFVRNICVLGIGDIKKAFGGIGLFANKFHLDFEYLALDCLEQTLYDLTWKQYLEDEDIDVSFYKKLDPVKLKFT